MAKTGKESTFCMGDDIPLAVMSEQPHVLYDYFKQRFAQVRRFRGIRSQDAGVRVCVYVLLGVCFLWSLL